MTEFLIRRFVKQYDDIENIRVRTAYGVLSSVVGILCNVLLFAGKLAVGLLIGSMAVTADAFNNLSDAASSVISLIGVKMAEKPADREHPFGHGRMEYITALVVAFLVVEVGITLLRSSVDKIRTPEEVAFEWASFCILLGSVAVKLWMALFNRKIGKRLDSGVILATAMDSMTDVAATGATIAAILISHFTGIQIDGIAGLLVSLLVIWEGIGIARDTVEPLLGQATDPHLYEEIKTMVESYDGIVGCHDLIVHNYGPNHSMAVLHAEIPRDMELEDAHALIDRVECELEQKLGIGLTIHMDPVETRDTYILSLKQKLGRVLKVLDPELEFHDFRVLLGEEQMTLIFDLVVPYSYDDRARETLLHQIMALMQEIDERFQCLIRLDRSYLNAKAEEH